MLKKITRCTALCKNSKKCKKNAKNGKFCFIHNFNKSHKVCTVCFDDCKVGNYRKLNCNHIFCRHCIYDWIILNPNCPCCRTHVTNDDFNVAFNYNIKLGNIINVYSHTIYIPRNLNLNLQFDDWISEIKWNSIKILFSRTLKAQINSATIYTYMTLSDYNNRFSLEFPDISYTIQNSRKDIDRYILKLI